jgi:hypothetical protein
MIAVTICCPLPVPRFFCSLLSMYAALPVDDSTWTNFTADPHVTASSGASTSLAAVTTTPAPMADMKMSKRDLTVMIDFVIVDLFVPESLLSWLLL